MRLFWGLLFIVLSFTSSGLADETISVKCEWIEYDVTSHGELTEVFERELKAAGDTKSKEATQAMFLKNLSDAKAKKKYYEATLPIRVGAPSRAEIRTQHERYSVNVNTRRVGDKNVLTVEPRVTEPTRFNAPSFDVAIRSDRTFTSQYIGKSERTTIEDGIAVTRVVVQFVIIECQ